MRRLASLILLLIGLAPAAVRAADDDPAAFVVGDPYCGLWSLFSAGVVLDRPIAFDALLQPKWLGGDGSSLSQLVDAADQNGLVAEPVRHWTTLDLRASRHPVVLHVRSRPGSPEYRHWLLYVGERDGRAVLVDGPRPSRTVGFGELATQWDGIGLVVYRPGEGRGVAWPHWLMLALGGAAVAGVVFVGGRRKPKAGRIDWRRQALALVALPAVAAALAGVDHLALAGGLLRQGEVVAAVRREHVVDFLADLSVAELKRRIADGSATVVDARYPYAFAAGHIPGAVNVTGPDDGRATSGVAGLPLDRDAPLVLYCQSKLCGYDDELALYLLGRGYTNLAFFSGGMNVWTAAGEPVEASPAEATP